MGRVTVIIPNWNGAKWLPGCLEALGLQTFSDFRIIVVDNGSNDASIDILRDHPLGPAIIELDRNHGFAYAVNRGIEQADTPFVALLNNDTKPHPDWLAALMEVIQKQTDDIYAVGSLMLNMQDPKIVDDAGNALSWYGAASKIHHGKSLAQVELSSQPFSISAGAAVYNRSFFTHHGLFEEAFESYLEDVELGLRARLLGYQCLLVPEAKILHQSHGSEIPKSKYVNLVTSNRLLLFWKNFPTRILVKKIWPLLYGQIYFFIAYGKPINSIKGYFIFLNKVGRIKRLKSPRLDTQEILSLLHDQMPSPHLSHFIGNYFKALWSKLVRQ